MIKYAVSLEAATKKVKLSLFRSRIVAYNWVQGLKYLITSRRLPRGKEFLKNN